MGRVLKRFFHDSYKLSRKKGKAASERWLNRHTTDPFVRKANLINYRARSAFKLIEIDDKNKLFEPGDVVIDCGAAPGSWTEVAVERSNSSYEDVSQPQGFVIAVDLLQFSPINGAVTLCNSDFTDIKVQRKISELLSGRRADVVLSDMAPNASGIPSVDHENICSLFRTALRFSRESLKENGNFVGKIWEGYLGKELKTEMTDLFKSVKTLKPAASRGESAEIFILGKGFKGKKEGGNR